MGRQVNFYVTPVDVAAVEVRLRKIEPMAVIHYRSPTAEPLVVPDLAFEEEGRRWLSFCLVRVSDLPFVVTDYVPAQGYWTVDVLRSPIVEFSSGYFDRKRLGRGRVYAVSGYYGADGSWVEKAPEYLRWSKRVLRAVRGEMAKKYDIVSYIGHDALAWLEREHGELDPL